MAVVRGFRPGDLAPVVELWNQSLVRDPITPGLFQNKVLLDPNYDPEGCLVALEGGQVVGFMLAVARKVPLPGVGLETGNGWITAFFVHPSYRRRGIGSALLEPALDFLRSQGRREVWVSPYAPNYFTPGVDEAAYPQALAFLQGRGFATAYRPLSMAASLLDFALPDWVQQAQDKLKDDDLQVGECQPMDLLPLLAFVHEHFAGDWERWVRETLRQITTGGGLPDVIWVAREGENILGYCQHTGERFGPFGVREDCRGRGLGAVLLFRCLERMRQKGLRNAWFMWASDRAARLYARAGFQETRRFAVMKKEL
ncbi:MAG: GNAT family N-acetyltransferase [Chloroflexi bacterium]|nr:GNAT family N-acetyltransferase [Chloroflexota bacterium]